MYQTVLRELVSMSNQAGNRVDYVQAGGGNTSAKFEDGYMAIKASGYLLKEMTDSVGFVVVNGAEMDAYHRADQPANVDHNKESMEIAMRSIKQVNGEKSARPSVEVGFHSVLKRFVLHLHPVYVNILMCAKGGVEMALAIMEKAGLPAVAVPYTMPGYDLTKLILNAVEGYKGKNGVEPQIVLLKNHGVLTHADTHLEALELMDKVNGAIIDALGLPVFPELSVLPGSGGFKSGCGWMKDVLSRSDIAQDIRYSPIYPDQLVYTANELSVDGSGEGKISIVDGEILYNVGEKEARALEETMVALVYVYHCIKEKGLSFETLTEEQCGKILGWDSEKYRKSLMAGE